VVENEKALAKAGDDPKKRRKVVRKKPAEGSIGWGEPTYTRLVEAEPEPLTSQFRVSHAMLLNVIARPGDAFAAMRHLLEDNDSDRPTQRRLIREAIAIYRSLLAAGVVERLSTPDSEGRTVRLTVDLQDNFALNQPLSTFALAALDLLDRESETYALDAVSVIESTLDQPRQVLSAQEHKARGEAVAAMKSEGIEYDERMELLQEVSYPKPLEELLHAAYEAYRRGHPWVADHELAPKSVVRDLWEQAMTFADFIQHYQLARSEGIVLRYLAGAYKALSQTVPDEAKTEELQDIIAWLGELVRQVDSSLLDEWEQLANPEEPVRPSISDLRPGQAGIESAPPVVTSNRRAFRVLVRNALFRRVELAARRQWDALGDLDAADGWHAQQWADAMAGYFAEHDTLLTGADARGPALLVIDERPDRWGVRQILDDPAGDHDWAITAEVDLAESDDQGRAAVHVTAVDRLD
jgi:hypothetical protein